MDYERIDLDAIPSDKIIDLVPQAVLASSSAPTLFEPIKYEGELSVDGGLKHYADPNSAIERCLKLVDDDESRVILDAVLLDSDGIDCLECKITKPSSQGMKEIIDAMQKHPDVHYRYLMSPHNKLVKDFDYYNFDHQYTNELLEAGKFDARKAIHEGPGARFKKLQNLCKKSEECGSWFSAPSVDKAIEYLPFNIKV